MPCFVFSIIICYIPMSRIPLFVNPTAKSSHQKRLNKWLARHGELFDAVISGSPEELEFLVRERVEKGEQVVAIAGGDGTLSQAAKGLIGSDTALAVVPSGTANVFARELRIFDSSLERSLKAIKGGCTKDVDVFLVNGVPFLQMAGIGLDARAIELTTAEAKKRLAGAAYVVSGVKAMFERQPCLKVTTDEGETVQGIAAIFGNGAKYGGPMKVFKKADHADGLLDVIVFTKGVGQILRDFTFSLARGGFDDLMHADIRYLQTRGCTVETGGEVPFELDGDLAGHGNMTIVKAAKPLKVFTVPVG